MQQQQCNGVICLPSGKIILNLLSSGSNTKAVKPMSLDESLNILMTGFLRGATSFLKGDIIKGGSTVTREVRVGVTYVSFLNLLNKKNKSPLT